MKNIIKQTVRFVFSLSAFVLFFLMAANSANAQNINISGEWKLVKEKSDLGILPDSVIAQNIKIAQNSEIFITRNFVKPSGKTSYSEKLTFDGASFASAPDAGIKRIAKIQWSPDKNRLIEDASMSGTSDGEAYEFKSTETWSLSADKKQLFIDRVITDEDEPIKNHLVYQKQ